MSNHNDSLLVAEYALGLLDQDETAAFEQRLQNDAKLRSDFVKWTEHFSVLYDDVEEIAPPASLKANIQDRLFAEMNIKAVPSSFKPKTKSRFQSQSSSWFWPANLVGGVLLATLAGFIYYQSQQTPFQTDYIASLVTQDQSLQVLASYDAKRKHLKVALSQSLAPMGRSHELWLIAGDNPPVSLGVLTAINEQGITVPDALASVIVGSTLAISDEPEGGSLTGGPTGSVLATAVVKEK